VSPAWRPRTFTEAKRYLTLAAYWKPLDRLSLDTIRREGVATRLRAITKDSGPVAAARAHVALSGFFSWCMGEGFVDANPTIGVNRPPASPPRERVLSDLELAAIWRSCRDDHYGWIIKLLVLLGARRAEIGGMRWSEFDLDAGTWTLPSSRSKNKRSLILPLPPLALSIIAAVPRRNVDQLFGWSPNGFAWWGQAKREFDARIEPPLKAWRVHDLRRTCATGLGNLGVQPHVIEAALNHASGHKAGVAGTYNRSPYEREVRAALAMWDDHVRALVEGIERTVVAFRG
jgi:integrase